MAQSPPPARCKVLCVDDNASALAVRAGILQSQGYAVETLTDERLAVAFLESHPVNVAVLDYLMPEIRGDHLATELRRRFPKLPILLISGAVDHPQSIGGADAFISKDAGHQKLLQILAKLAQSGEAPCSVAQDRRTRNTAA